MNIYGVKDRLLNFFVQQFLATNDKTTLSNVADAVNGDRGHAIEKSPHHFEVWRLGEISEEGHVTPSKELLADCSSLVRPSLREIGEHASNTRQEPARRRQGAPGGTEPNASPRAVAPQEAPYGANSPGQQAHPGPDGIPGHSER